MGGVGGRLATVRDDRARPRRSWPRAPRRGMPERAPHRSRARRPDTRRAPSPGAPAFVPGAGTTRTRPSWALLRYSATIGLRSLGNRPVTIGPFPQTRAEDPPRTPAAKGAGAGPSLTGDGEMDILGDRAAAVRHHDSQGVQAFGDCARAPGKA